MLYKIEGLGNIHEAAEDIPTIPGEVADSLYNSPCAHVSRDTELIGKLEVIDAKPVTKQKDDDPIKEFENETTNHNCSVVFTRIQIAKLIFQERNKCCKEKVVSHVTMNQKTLYCSS